MDRMHRRRSRGGGGGGGFDAVVVIGLTMFVHGVEHRRRFGGRVFFPMLYIGESMTLSPSLRQGELYCCNDGEKSSSQE